MYSAHYLKQKLQLQQHPEGGWFKEVYRSEGSFPTSILANDYSGERDFCTSIYYLLNGDEFSLFHKIKSDEVWHYYTGNSEIEIVLLKDGTLDKKIIGNGTEFQVVIPKNTWFAAHLKYTSGYALVGCTVSPGFHFDDFELGNRESLLEQFPFAKKEILLYTNS